MYGGLALGNLKVREYIYFGTEFEIYFITSKKNKCIGVNSSEHNAERNDRT